MVEMNPTGYGTYGPRSVGSIGLSMESATDAAAAGRVIGSCAFLCSHGDLRIEWEEKDHPEILKLIRAKMKAGVEFCILDPASLDLVPIKRANRVMGRELYVRDPDIKKLMDGGFSRLATTRFGGIDQIKTLDFARSAEDAARADTIAIPPLQEAEADSLITAAAIAAFLDRELRIRPKPKTRFTRRTVYNWASGGKLPVGRPPGSTTLVASKSKLRQWFDDIARKL